MKNLALRKSKVNAVGVVGLVENMPGGNAQRPETLNLIVEKLLRYKY